MLKYLRIAVTALSLTACVLFVVLWVRSYWGRIGTEALVTPTHRCFVQSLEGTAIIHWHERIFLSPEWRPYYPENFYFHRATQKGLQVWRGPEYSGNTVAVSFSYWLLTFAAVLAAAIPWIRWSRRFSLRTLLIATTLVAVVLGVIVVSS